jgi:hypothetical protein
LANVPKQIVATALTTSTATYYTTTTSATIVKEILICNTSTADRTVTVSIGGFSVVSSITVAPKETVVLGLCTVVPTAKAITASANGTGVNLLVSAVEVS